jgi:coenzyme F420-0:L-glutamate ligase/coenzyme F420-1:gamma-L-glutamate ligase
VTAEVRVIPLDGIPEIEQGDDLAGLLLAAAARVGGLEDADVLVVAQKAVSKAEGRVVRLDDVEPSAQALELADDRDPRHVEWILRESSHVVRVRPPLIIAETRHGFVCANAGVDASNVTPGFVTVLPRDPDASAERLRFALAAWCECPVAVIVSDTFGRPWREGAVNVALGVAGLRPLVDYRGCLDPYGRRLESTVTALADELAGAAEVVMRKTARTPVAIVRGAGEWCGDGTGRQLVRDASRDLFR